MTYYISKYALTQGILTRIGSKEVRLSDDGRVLMCPYCEMFHWGEWHRTRKEAVKVAEKMQLRKIAALKRQLAKLEAMTFVGGSISAIPSGRG
jgi:hypothetical protein